MIEDEEPVVVDDAINPSRSVIETSLYGIFKHLDGIETLVNSFDGSGLGPRGAALINQMRNVLRNTAAIRICAETIRYLSSEEEE